MTPPVKSGPRFNPMIASDKVRVIDENGENLGVMYTREAIGAQQRWREVSGVNRTHYCGAYWFHGFHEDGLNSALRVAGRCAYQSADNGLAMRCSCLPGCAGGWRRVAATARVPEARLRKLAGFDLGAARASR